MADFHGIKVLEQETSLVAPITATSGIQVVIGTAPVNLAANPDGVTNTPVLVNSWAEAVNKLGYSSEKDDNGHFLYTLCASMYASFKVLNVAPIIYINVLDPKKHKMPFGPVTVPVEDMEALVRETGILLDKVTITCVQRRTEYTPVSPVAGDDPSARGWYVLVDGAYLPATDTAVQEGTTYYEATETEETVTLENGVDYSLSFDDNGYLAVTVYSTEISSISVSGTQIDPTAVTESDIIGVSAVSGD